MSRTAHAAGVRETTATGLGALELTTRLLQRARVADPVLGLYEAADLQWWWRTPQESDAVEQVFWVDDDGPVAGALLNGGGEAWQADPVVVPGVAGPDVDAVWARTLEQVRRHAAGAVETAVREDDTHLRELVEASGLVAGKPFNVAWMEAEDRPAVRPLAEGFVLVDRTQHPGTPHHMVGRSGAAVADRLAQCSLYDPTLDLVAETTDGRVAGYVLFWADPVTRVGLVEPVRVEDEFHRRGLASAIITAGIERLAARGMRRIKVGYQTEAAGAVYEGVGFRTAWTDVFFAARVDALA